MRDGEAGDGDSGDAIVEECLESVGGKPVEERDEVFEGSPGRSSWRLASTLSEWVIGGQDVPERIPEGLPEGRPRPQSHWLPVLLVFFHRLLKK